MGSYTYAITGSPLFDASVYIITGIAANFCVAFFAIKSGVIESHSTNAWIAFGLLLLVFDILFIFPGMKILVYNYVYLTKVNPPEERARVRAMEVERPTVLVIAEDGFPRTVPLPGAACDDGDSCPTYAASCPLDPPPIYSEKIL